MLRNITHPHPGIVVEMDVARNPCRVVLCSHMGQGEPILEKQMLAPVPEFTTETRIFFESIRPVRHIEFQSADFKHLFNLSPSRIREIQEKIYALHATARLTGTWP